MIIYNILGGIWTVYIIGWLVWIVYKAPRKEDNEIQEK